MSIKSYAVKSLSEYISAIEEICGSFDCHASDVWYRGISSERYDLKPGTVWREIGEDRHCGMIDEFMTSSVLYEDISKQSDYEVYALMQHYGLPTRLLDWSLSPLTALYFSLERDEMDGDRVVWAMNPTQLNNSTLGYPHLIYAHNEDERLEHKLEGYLPSSIRTKKQSLHEKPAAIVIRQTNRRISSQQGAFTIHGSQSESIDHYFTEGGCEDICKIMISGDKTRKKIQKSLEALNIREDSIYQDLNSLSRRVIREYGY